jgi:DNA end-binding protein Ku
MAVTVWKGQLTFGLVSIPIRIIRAARQERVRFQQVYRPQPHDGDEEPAPPPASRARQAEARATPAEAARIRPAEPEPPVERVQRQYTATDTGEAVAPRDLLKGYEYSKGQFAVFRPEEIRRFRAETTRDMEILEFVKLETIDPVFFNASYYVTPDRGGEKPYSLLFEAMRKSGYAALARFAMHGREQILALRPGQRGVIMHTLFFEGEIHAEDEYAANPSLVTPQEMKLAELLISQLATDFDPSKFKDERMARIQASIGAKIEGGGAARESARPSAPVIDILEALRRSLERKPPAQETGAGKPKRRKTGG